MNNFFNRAFAYAKNISKRTTSINPSDSIGLMLNKMICIRWFNEAHNKNNFGDALNPLIIEYFAQKKAVSSTHVLNILHKPVIYFIGSILDNLNEKESIICGAGFQKDNATVRTPPLAVLAVRGPLSRDIFLRNGVECPEVYGDPAIVLPHLFKNIWNKKNWDVGIIAHYADKEVLKKTAIRESELSYKIIDIESPPDVVINEICRSRYILSSSLHGIIVAHAYEVPATWIRLSRNVIGGSFKFRDYANSVSTREISSYDINGTIDLMQGIELSTLYEQQPIRENLIRVMSEYFEVEDAIKS